MLELGNNWEFGRRRDSGNWKRGQGYERNGAAEAAGLDRQSKGVGDHHIGPRLECRIDVHFSKPKWFPPPMTSARATNTTSP